MITTWSRTKSYSLYADIRIGPAQAALFFSEHYSILVCMKRHFSKQVKIFFHTTAGEPQGEGFYLGKVEPLVALAAASRDTSMTTAEVNCHVMIPFTWCYVAMVPSHVVLSSRIGKIVAIVCSCIIKVQKYRLRCIRTCGHFLVHLCICACTSSAACAHACSELIFHTYISHPTIAYVNIHTLSLNPFQTLFQMFA